jgi:hypothetical protein
MAWGLDGARGAPPVPHLRPVASASYTSPPVKGAIITSCVGLVRHQWQHRKAISDKFNI